MYHMLYQSVLHYTTCELFGDNFHDDWRISSGVTEHHHRLSDGSTSAPAERIRKALEDYLFTH